VPWGIAFLPDGDALVTERDAGRILRVTPSGLVGTVQRLTEVRPAGNGGLLGIAASPRYRTDHTVYVYYTTARDNRIARLTLGGRPEPIVTGLPKSEIHNGGRLAFGPDGMLYASTGDSARRGAAQERSRLDGKVLRVTPDGRPAPGNPFPGSLVYTYGHRNVEGFAWDPAGRMFASELGESTADEVNRLEAGHDYGWPVVEGHDQTGRFGGFTEPLVTWRPAEASPGGVAVHRGALYVAALRGRRLWRVPLQGGGGMGRPVPLLVGRYGRLRTVAAAPDGSLWILTSNCDGSGPPDAPDDRILRLTP
jgi:glucose/arabinose dehydrogenase